MSLDSNLSKGKWSREEIERFNAAYLELGPDWKSITHAVGTRSIVQVRSHAQRAAPSLDRGKKYQMWMQQAASISVAIDSITRQEKKPKVLPPGRNKLFELTEDPEPMFLKPKPNRQGID